MKKNKVYSGKELVNNYDDRHFGGRGGRFVFKKDLMALEYVMGSSTGLLLDIPCGTGIYSKTFDEKGFSVIASDASKSMLEITGQRRGSFPRVLCDAIHLPFKDDVFNLIVTIRLFQHLPENDVDGIMQEMSRTVRTDGLVIFDTFHWSPRKNLLLKRFLKGEIYVYSRRDTEDLMSRAKLGKVHAISVYLFSPLMYRKMPVWFLRTLEFLEKIIPQRWLLRTFWACEKKGFVG